MDEIQFDEPQQPKLPVLDLTEMSESEVFNYTQAIRRKLADKMLMRLDTDPESVEALTRLLDSMDKQVIAKDKMKKEEEQLAGDNEVKAILARLMGNIPLNPEIIEHDPEGYSEVDDAIVIPDDIVASANITANMLEVSPRDITYDEIMQSEEVE